MRHQVNMRQLCTGQVKRECMKQMLVVFRLTLACGESMALMSNTLQKL